jgi:hypothetical protein
MREPRGRPDGPCRPGGAASLDAAAGSSGTKLAGDVVTGEYPFAVGHATPIASTCSTGAGHTWSLDFGHTQCLIVRPDWNTASAYEPYELTDDVKLITLQDKKTKRITHVRLLAQDVIGEAGIQHETDWTPVAVPVESSRSGGTLHVHATNVEVWRLSGHTGGTRVAMIGRISIGDLVYR